MTKKKKKNQKKNKAKTNEVLEEIKEQSEELPVLDIKENQRKDIYQIVLIPLVIVSLFFLIYFFLIYIHKTIQDKSQSAYDKGIIDAGRAFMKNAKLCRPFEINFQGEKAKLINLDCLQMQINIKD